MPAGKLLRGNEEWVSGETAPLHESVEKIGRSSQRLPKDRLWSSFSFYSNLKDGLTRVDPVR